MRHKAKPETIIVVSNPSEGVVKRTYAVGEYRTNRFYQERRERGWKSLNERIAEKERAGEWTKN